MQTFDVSGMSCEHCVRAVTRAIGAVDPAAQVSVDLGAGRVTVRDARTNRQALAAAIEGEGYGVAPSVATGS